jgi:O-antigen/teichoic acid export membrane protein
MISRHFYKKMEIRHVDINLRETVKEGRDVLFFGGLISINSFLPVLSNYIIQLFINDLSGLASVGFFNTGQLIINSYVGIVFSAMGMEYYPRLASYNMDVKKEEIAVSQQAIMSVLIMIPIIIFFLAFLPFLINLFFTSEFQAAVPMLSWLILAMFIKSVSWCMGYVIIARADSKVFMKTSVIFNTLYILFCTVGFYLNGLKGLGIGFLMYYTVHLFGVYGIVKLRYKLTFENNFYKFVLYGAIVCISLGLVNEFFTGITRYVLYFLFFVACSLFSIIEINKRVPLKDFVLNFINKRKNGNKE